MNNLLREQAVEQFKVNEYLTLNLIEEEFENGTFEYYLELVNDISARDFICEVDSIKEAKQVFNAWKKAFENSIVEYYYNSIKTDLTNNMSDADMREIFEQWFKTFKKKEEK